MTQDGHKRARASPGHDPRVAALGDVAGPRVREKAVLVGVGRGIVEATSMSWRARRIAGAEPVAPRVLQTRSDPDPSTFVGKAKLDEIHRTVERSGATAVILNDELSPGQLRTLESG